MTIGAIISYARKRKGWNQTFVAKQIGMKLSTYAKKESDGGFSDEQLRLLSKLLRIKITDLQKARVNDKISTDDAVKIILDGLQKLMAMNYTVIKLLATHLAEQRDGKLETVLTEAEKIANLKFDELLQDEDM